MIYEYWFARMKNISDSKKKKLRKAYGSAKEIYYIEETQLRLQNFLTKKDIEQLKMARKQKDLEEKYYNRLCLFSTIFSPVSCFLRKNTTQSSPNISSAQSESLLLGESVSQEYWKSPFFLRPRHP